MDLLSEAQAVGAITGSDLSSSVLPRSGAGEEAGEEEAEAEGFRSFGGIEEFDRNEPELLHDKTEASVASTGGKAAPSRSEALVEQLRSDIIGGYNSFTTPFGPKPCVYADWTASGRAVQQIEDYVAREVLPFYGNTHTVTSITGNQSTSFRHEARQIIAQAVNAKISGKAASDIVLFTGNGTTGALNKLILSLELHLPHLESGNVNRSENLRPVVFTSSYEHHSNLLPWRESVAEVVTIAYSPSTGVCLEDLQRKLEQYNDRKVKIGAFSAASNVTGVLTDVHAVAIAMHLAGGIVVFDYATAAPYVKIDMNPALINNSMSAYAYMDAIVFSGHKFIGGPGSPGVLVCKKKLLLGTTASEASGLKPPTTVGGGTVFFVTKDHHRYLANRTEREEGGTPNILADIRMGLVMHLKQTIGSAWIEEEEKRISNVAQLRLLQHPNIVLMGRRPGNSDSHNHLPVFSFLIRAGPRFLHHNFASALLNDLFGVQSRGGCQCAGPFAQEVLGLSDADVQALEHCLLDKHEVLRPGFSRFSLPYWMSKAEIDFVLSAVEFVATHGYLFLPLYRHNPKTGEWAHLTRLTRFPERKWLSNFKLGSGSSDAVSPSLTASHALQNVWGVRTEQELFASVREAVESELVKVRKAFDKKSGARNALDADSELKALEALRWFVVGDDVMAPTWTTATSQSAPVGPVQPQRWLSGVGEEASPTAPNDVSSASSAYVQKRNVTMPAYAGGEKFSGDSIVPRYVNFTADVVHATSVPAIDAQILKGKISSSENTGKTSSLVVSGVKHQEESTKPQEPVRAAPESSAKPAADCSTGSCFVTRSDGSQPTDVTSDASKQYSGKGQFYDAVPGRPLTGKLYAPPKKIMKMVGQAIRDWNMIEEGDRLLLGLSGGKDSLCMLHILLSLQKRSPVKFTIACATVDPQTESFDPSPLIGYVQSLNVPYHYLSEPIVELAKTKLQGDSLCAFCARFKRGLLYSCCRNYKYNKLILAQHLDDLAESFIMSALHNGQVRTMKANYGIEAGDVNVIRPFVYVRENETRNFSVTAKLPIINENCPACFENPKERHRVKKLLAQEEAMIPDLFCNLRRALQPLMDDSIYETMKEVNRAIEKRNVKKHYAPGSVQAQMQAQQQGLGAAAPMDTAEDEAANGETQDVQQQRKRKFEETGGSPSSASSSQMPSTQLPDVVCTDEYCAPCFELA